MKAKLKIAYILPSLELGGSEKQAVEMATRLDRSRFEAQLICLRPGNTEWEQALTKRVKVKVFAFKDGFRFLIANLPEVCKLVQYLKDEKPHVVHVFPYWPATLGVFAAKAAGIPAIVSSRRETGYAWTFRSYQRELLNLANLFTNVVLANSEAVKSFVFLRERVSPTKLRVIYNGCDGAKSDAPGARHGMARRKLGISDDEILAGMVANLHSRKGQKLLLEAMPQILSRFPLTKVVLVGGERQHRYRDTLESVAHSLGIEDKVIFAGERKDVAELLRAMDIGVFCPLYGEGFSNAVLEMMAAGLPVVATDVGGNREAILDGQTGLLVPPGDSAKLAEAILRLLQDRELASRMGAAAHERVRKLFSMERMIEETEQLYTELVRAKSPTAVRSVD